MAPVLGVCFMIIGLPVGVAAQDDVYVPEHPWLVVRAASATASAEGSIDATATCKDGETLLGGGYRSERPALDASSYLSFEASYPSGPRSWRVIAYHRGETGGSASVIAEPTA